MKRRQFQLVLRGFFKRKPFQPFTIELVSGARIEVRHPEALTQYEESILVKSNEGVQQVFDHTTVAQFVDGTRAS